MINIGTLIICCICTALIGYLIGLYINEKTSRKDMEDLGNFYIADTKVLVDKLIHYRDLVDEYSDRNTAKKVKSVHMDDRIYKTIKACPNCDHELIYGSKYCDQCGQKVDWEVDDV